MVHLEQAQDAALPDCKGDNPFGFFPAQQGQCSSANRYPQDKPGPALFTSAPSFVAGLQHNKTWFDGFGLFWAEREMQGKKTIRSTLEDLARLLQHSAGPRQKGFIHPFCQGMEKYIHPHMRKGQAVQFPATAPVHSATLRLPPPQLGHLNFVYKHKHSRVGHKRAS